jgi:protein-S-isoprenylcysteine O-methyltransferase Ste14
MNIRIFVKWAEHEYSPAQRLTVVICGVLLFGIGIPCLLVLASSAVDPWLGLPRLNFGKMNPALGLLLMMMGGCFALWAVEIQFIKGKGTPMPVMPTQKLVVDGPFAYCRNPMIGGITLALTGVSIWIGSVSALVFTALFATIALTAFKFVEEKELEARFGAEYLGYKQRTPFLFPRFRRMK